MDVENDPDKIIDFNNMFYSGVKVLSENNASQNKNGDTGILPLN